MGSWFSPFLCKNVGLFLVIVKRKTYRFILDNHCIATNNSVPTDASLLQLKVDLIDE